MNIKYFFGIFLVAFILISCTPITSKDNYTFTLDGYGIFTDVNNTQSLMINYDTNNKITQPNNVLRITKNSNVIQGNLGTNFGIDYSVSENFDITSNRVLCKYIHPEMKNPQTNKSTTIDGFYITLSGLKHNQMGWKFDNEWEIVKGKWQMQILYNDQIMLTQDFIVE